MMKNVSILLLFSLFIVVGCSENKTKHLGTWKSNPTQLLKGEGNTLTLTFNDKNEVVWNGSNEGYSLFFNYSYEIDYSKSPIQLDIIVTLKESGDVVGHYFGIVRFPSIGMMEYRIKENGPWFKSFDTNDKESTLLLKMGK